MENHKDLTKNKKDESLKHARGVWKDRPTKEKEDEKEKKSRKNKRRRKDKTRDDKR